MRFLAPLIVGTSALIGWAAPQSPTTQNTKPEVKRQDGAGNLGTAEATQTDSFLASWLLVTNKNEVELATLAQQKATDPALKQLAQKVLDDHRQFITKLQPFATADLQGAPGFGDRQDDSQRPQPASFASMGDGFDHEALFKELGAKCLQTARKELDAKQGAAFDQTYTAMLVASHSMCNDMLMVFQQHASPAFKTVLGDGQKTVAAHLQSAKAHCEKLQSHAPTALERGTGK